MRKNPRLQIVSAVLVAALASACGSSVSAPEQALQDFYGHLNGGDYTTALNMYSAEMVEAFSAPDSGFEEWARKEARDGTISRLEVISEEENAGKAVIDFTVHFDDGGTQSRKVTLVREDGEWRMGMIG